jgi:hypothetical protein
MPIQDLERFFTGYDPAPAEHVFDGHEYSPRKLKSQNPNDK